MDKFYRNIFLIACFIHLLIAFLSLGYHHGDEHFQVMEFAGYKLQWNAASDLAWEYSTQMRPALQPLICFGIVKLFSSIGFNDPFFYATVLRLLSAILSLYAIHVLVKSFLPQIKSLILQEYFITLSFLLWFIPYLDTRFSSECWSGSLLAIAVAFINTHYQDNKPIAARQLFFFTGFILGLAFITRFQSVLFVGGLFLWILLVKKEKMFSIFILLSGVSAALLAGVLIDYWFYGKPVFTAWNYFLHNIVLDKVSSYGVSPWWLYFLQVADKAIYPLGILIIAAFVYFWIYFPKHILALPLFIYVLITILIGHKEIRFLFPLVKFVPLVFILSAAHLFRNKTIQKKKLISALFWCLNFIPLAAVCFKPADTNSPLIRFVNGHYSGQPVKIFYDKENPYIHYGLPFNFYNRVQTSFAKIDSLSNLCDTPFAPGKKIFITKKNLPDEFSECNTRWTIVYTSFPPFIRKNLNINHWMERTAYYRVYEGNYISI